MSIPRLRNELSILKIHLDECEKWVEQTKHIVHNVEEALFDIEDGKLLSEPFDYNKFLENINIKNLKPELSICG